MIDLWNAWCDWLAQDLLHFPRRWWILAILLAWAVVEFFLWRRRKAAREREAEARRREALAATAVTSVPRVAGFDFDVLDEVPVDGSARPLTEAQRQFVRQRLAFGDDDLDARPCEGGSVLRARGNREALVLDVPVKGRRVRAEKVVASDPRLDLDGPVALDARWPDEVLIDDRGNVMGYLAPALDDAFLARGEDADSQNPRTIADALETGDPELTLDQRLAIAAAVCRWLQAQHDAGLVNGQVDGKHLLIDSTGSRITPLHYRRLRQFGSSDWGRGAVGSQDADRAGFARLAWMLLVPKDEKPVAWLEGAHPVAGLDEFHAARVRSLLSRSLGNAGTMPTMPEWAAALGATTDVSGQPAN